MTRLRAITNNEFCFGKICKECTESIKNVLGQHIDCRLIAFECEDKYKTKDGKYVFRRVNEQEVEE